MTQKLCPACTAQNPLDNRYCGRCGSRLDQPLVAQRPSDLTIGRSPLLPAPTMRQVGRAAAASLLAIAAEVGLAWLRRRAEPGEEAALPSRQKAASSLPARALPGPPGRVSAIFGRRIVRRWQQGRQGQETVEEEVWWYES
jgi:hypothetical protein